MNSALECALDRVEACGVYPPPRRVLLAVTTGLKLHRIWSGVTPCRWTRKVCGFDLRGRGRRASFELC